MNTQCVLDEVERRVAERLPAVLFERGVILHAKSSFRQGCHCGYCQTKREATAKIGTLPSGIFDTIDSWDYDERKEAKAKIRHRFRVIYRAKLKDALNETSY